MITLIFVDRAVEPAYMVVIRRELRQTSGAGPADCGLSHRSHVDTSFAGSFTSSMGFGSSLMVAGYDFARRLTGPSLMIGCDSEEQPSREIR